MKRFWIIIAVAGIVLLAMSTRQYLTRPSKGDAAPPFELKTVEGKSVSSAAYRGQLVVVHFWATWCGSCLEEFPPLVQFSRDFANDGLSVVAISEDRDLGELSSFLSAAKPDFPVLIDDGGVVADAYHSYGVPESFIIGRDGVILWRYDGSVDWDNPKLRRAITNMISARHSNP